MDGKKQYTQLEAIIALCKARDDINTAISNLRAEARAGRLGVSSWDTYCMWVAAAAKAAAKLRNQSMRPKRW